jgi:phenylpropionate dioxygenase-like ring-hydroxylating dioxygenase large terminal subunit
MRDETARRLIGQARAELAMPVAPLACEVPAARYRDAAWLAREWAALFGGPRPIAASSALPAGSCRPYEDSTRSLLLVRDGQGRARAFYNACRHRATRLVDAPREAKAIVCPYHGWTYDLAGSLVHVPHAEAFPSTCAQRDLVEVPLYERHGLLWLGGEDPAAYLGELDDDLAALDLANHVVFREARVTRACNWKLLIEAFLDGYHIRVLHRDSVYRFFIDAASVAERVGPHIRAVTARRALREAPEELAGVDPRMLVTPSFVLFPSTVIIAHPDFVSVVTVLPVAADRMDYHHVMLVPAARAGETEHWAKSWALIEETVFQREDLWACEQMQRGLSSGATEHLLFGGLEHAVAWFHAELERRLECHG